jgi:hypothetical protein
MAQQKPTEYTPTTCERRILEVLLDPNNRLKTVTDICRLAECDRTTYYKAFSKPEFVELVKEQSKNLATKHVAQIMNAFVKEAQRGSFQHGKVILEMADIYVEKQETNQKGELNVNITIKGA